MSSATLTLVYTYIRMYCLSIYANRHTSSLQKPALPLERTWEENPHLLLKPEAPVKPSFRNANPRVSSHVTPVASVRGSVDSGKTQPQSWAGSWSINPPLKSIGRGVRALHLCPSIQRRDQSCPGHRCPAMAVAVGPIKATIRKDSLSWGVCVQAWNRSEFSRLPWWPTGSESTCRCRGLGFDPWSGRIPHAAGQLSPRGTKTEPATRKPHVRPSETPASETQTPPILTASPSTKNLSVCF